VALPGSSLAPLRRKPKQLRKVPTVFSPTGGAPLVLDLSGYRGDGDLDEAAGGQGVLVTTQRAAVRDLAELAEEREPDPEIAAMARRIARNLAVRRRTLGPRPDRGAGKLVSVPYRYRSDDIDLDRTIEVLTERPVPEDTDIIVRERMRSRRAVVLIADVHDGPPELAVEVRSPGTWALDVGPKLRRYEASGAVEVWLVDTPSSTVLVFRRDGSEPGYADAIEVGRGGVLTSPLLPGFAVDADELFADLG
jgi:Putative restriction endonuclease